MMQFSSPSLLLLLKAALLLLLFSLFPLPALLALLLLYYALLQLATRALSRIQRRGLLYYLPQAIKQFLSKRRPFDRLCDLWFLTQGSYIKLLFRPLFQQVDPSQAHNLFQHTSSEVKALVFSKNIMTSLPESVKNVLQPRSQQQQMGSQESASTMDRLEERALQRQNWDGLDQFRRSSPRSQAGLVRKLRISLKMVSQVVNLKRTLQTTNLLKFFLFSSLILIYRLTLSRHNKAKLLFSTAKMFALVTVLVVWAGSLGMLCWKFKNRLPSNQENLSIQEQKDDQLINQ